MSTLFLLLAQRYRIFLFPWKRLRSLTHSISEKSVFFFFRKLGKKKKTAVFFFSPEKDYMPLTQLFRMSLYKKIGGKLCFFKNAIFNHILRCIFFFQDLYFFFCIFFSSEKIKLYSLTRFKPLYFFFPAPEKKNTPFLLTHSILSENDTKVIFSRNKKKYGTFGRTLKFVELL